MNNSALARKNMLDCQLATNGIVDPAVLDAFGRVPRELFLPPSLRAAAYIDDDIAVQRGVFCMEPVVHARMIQAAQPRRSDAVLNIGDMTGYSSAIFSDLVSTVVALEPKAGALDAARRIWDDLNYCNIAVVSGVEREGSPEHAPYDLIFINGAVASVPDMLLDQLARGGRLVAVVRPSGTRTGMITVVEKIDEGKYSTRSLFDAATSYACGFEPESAFTF